MKSLDSLLFGIFFVLISISIFILKYNIFGIGCLILGVINLIIFVVENEKRGNSNEDT